MAAREREDRGPSQLAYEPYFLTVADILHWARAQGILCQGRGSAANSAVCEGFFGRLKTEWFYPGNWQSTTVEQFIQALDSYIRWYNEKRIKMSLGARSPVDYRRSLGLTA